MADALAQQFVQAFYQTFDTNRAALNSLYVSLDGCTIQVREAVLPLVGTGMDCPKKSGCLKNETATMIFEDKTCTGKQAINEKLVSLPFQSVQHAITTLDSVLTPDGTLLIMVVGQLKTDNDPPHAFSQTFLLKQFGDSLFIVSDIFRLNLHHQ